MKRIKPVSVPYIFKSLQGQMRKQSIMSNLQGKTRKNKTKQKHAGHENIY